MHFFPEKLGEVTIKSLNEKAWLPPVMFRKLIYKLDNSYKKYFDRGPRIQARRKRTNGLASSRRQRISKWLPIVVIEPAQKLGREMYGIV